jgi:hydrogenase-4 transcriptional activator
MDDRLKTTSLGLERDAWRLAAEQLELAALLPALARRVVDVLGDTVWTIRRLEAEHMRLECVVSTGDATAARRPLSNDEVAVLRNVFTRDVIGVWGRGVDDPVRRMLRTQSASHAAIAVRLEHPIALVIEGEFDPELAEPLARALVPVLMVSLANDRRVHELERLREAVEADNRALLTRLQRQDISESIVGAQTGLREVMERVQQVAPTDAPVLILGETGSGKEVVARAIHTRSARHDGPFLRVNCGAIPPELVDSELFGHERGSFTGAVATRRGWFERADGGTLFLDEVGELPAAAQVRLLRVLQDGAFERVGGSAALTADVRIVAATHRDMHEMLAGGQFREDLWYRISVFPVALPPLRSRVQDIPALAAHFAASAGMRLHGVPLHPTEDDLSALAAYEWPGNVRELAAVIERAAILGGGTHLDIARSLGDRPPVTRRLAVAPPPMPTGSLEMVNREAIHDALARARGRIEGSEGAAALLGIHPATLRSRMRKLGIEWQRWRER